MEVIIHHVFLKISKPFLDGILSLKLLQTRFCADRLEYQKRVINSFMVIFLYLLIRFEVVFL